MTKTFTKDSIIQVSPELVVIVDKEGFIPKNHRFYSAERKALDIADLGEIRCDKVRWKVVATLKGTLKGVPRVVLPDQKFDWRKYLLQKGDASEVTDYLGTTYVSLGTAEWACKQVEQAAGGYTEADLRKAIEMSKEEVRNGEVMTSTSCHCNLFEKKYTTNEIIQSLHPFRFPERIVLDYEHEIEDFSGSMNVPVYSDEWTLKTQQDGTIIPKEVSYG